jgi:hypothetical protein
LDQLPVDECFVAPVCLLVQRDRGLDAGQETDPERPRDNGQQLP